VIKTHKDFGIGMKRKKERKKERKVTSPATTKWEEKNGVPEGLKEREILTREKKRNREKNKVA